MIHAKDLYRNRSRFIVPVLLGVVLAMPSTIAAVSAADLTGTNRSDMINGTGEDDTIHGLGGRDIISAGAGNDKAYGGSGADKIYGYRGDDLLDGGEGNDYIQDSYGYNTVYGRGGADTINILFVEDTGDQFGSVGGTIHGGSGPDTISCEGYSCAIYGEGDNDKIYLQPHDVENVAYGGIDNDYIKGIGQAGALYGEDGDDTLVGGAEHHGGAGADRFVCDQYTEIFDYNPAEGDVIENESLCGGVTMSS